MPEILHQRLPVAPWMAPYTLRLPGTLPISIDDWLQRDEVFAAQMAQRDALIAAGVEVVHRITPEALAPADELLGLVLRQLANVPGYTRQAGGMRRPDGVVVPLEGSPLSVAGRLVQEDLMVLQKPQGAAEHMLTGAILCFPSNWTLREKIGRPLSRIHLPVAAYDASMACRVQRLLDGLRPETPLMRANLLAYGMAELYNPRREFDRHRPAAGAERFIRVERQVLLRLPVTRAVVFSIHTYMVRPEALSPEQRAKLLAARPDLLGEAAPQSA